MKYGLLLPASKAKQDRIKDIEGKLRILFRKDDINLLDISNARILTEEYKELTDWDRQESFRLLAKV